MYILNENIRNNSWSTKDKGGWRPRWNGEIYNLYKNLNIVDDIKIRRLEWVGHIVKI